MLYPFELPAPDDLTAAQLDGIKCIYCEYHEPPSRPVGHLRGSQVFAHPYCAESHRMETAA